jgi:cyclopropane-fatty-acyl-phospholipid synthase
LSDLPRPSRIERFLQRRIKRGRLTVRLGSGRPMTFGDGSGPEISVAIDRSGMLRLLRDNSSLSVGECYMDGALRMERGEVFDPLRADEGDLAAAHPARSPPAQ